MIDQGFLAFSCFDPVERYLHVRNGLASVVILGRFVELLGEEEVLEGNVGELFLDFASIRVDLFVGLLRL